MIYEVVASPVGLLVVGVSGVGVRLVTFVAHAAEAQAVMRQRGADTEGDQPLLSEATAQLRAYFAGTHPTFALPVDLAGQPDFHRQVLLQTMLIPPGTVQTYGDLARAVEQPGGSRAVGVVMARNPIPIIIPCHRVVASDGSLHGYSGRGGLETKRALLRLEGWTPPEGDYQQLSFFGESSMG